VKAERPQKGNPHKLTFWQHVFPARSIKRFAGPDGRVAVKRCGAEREFRLLPEDQLFCARRSWDQRAETGFMKQIEDEFQTLAEEVIGGLRAIDVEKSRVVTNFFALWCSRFQRRHSPTPDRRINGVVGESLSKDQEEIREKNRIGYFRVDQMMPGRNIAGMQIQMTIDQIDAQFRGVRWGVVTSREGEFILPDTFDMLTVVPVTPTTCLICAPEDLDISKTETAKLNRLALNSHREYCVARDFAHARADFVIWRTTKDKSDSKSPLIIVECKSDNVTIKAADYGPHLELIDMGTQTGTTFPIHAKMYEAINSADIILIDLTGVRPNVCVEAGYALRNHEKNRLIFIFQPTKAHKAVPFDLNTFRYESFKDIAEIPEKIKHHILTILRGAAVGK